MGLIAASGRPGALELFRKVMLASASVPIAFPPVFFDVEAGGGATTRCTSTAPSRPPSSCTAAFSGLPSSRARRTRSGAGGHLRDPQRPTEYSRQARRRGPCADHRAGHRSFRPGGGGRGLFIIYAVAQREQASFHWVTIPEGVEIPGTEVFDPVKMSRALRGRLPDCARRPRLVRRSSGAARGSFSTINGEKASWPGAFRGISVASAPGA